MDSRQFREHTGLYLSLIMLLLLANNILLSFFSFQEVPIPANEDLCMHYYNTGMVHCSFPICDSYECHPEWVYLIPCNMNIPNMGKNRYSNSIIRSNNLLESDILHTENCTMVNHYMYIQPIMDNYGSRLWVENRWHGDFSYHYSTAKGTGTDFHYEVPDRDVSTTETHLHSADDYVICSHISHHDLIFKDPNETSLTADGVGAPTGQPTSFDCKLAHSQLYNPDPVNGSDRAVWGPELQYCGASHYVYVYIVIMKCINFSSNEPCFNESGYTLFTIQGMCLSHNICLEYFDYFELFQYSMYKNITVSPTEINTSGYQANSRTMTHSDYALGVSDTHTVSTHTYECYKCVWLYPPVYRVTKSEFLYNNASQIRKHTTTQLEYMTAMPAAREQPGRTYGYFVYVWLYPLVTRTSLSLHFMLMRMPMNDNSDNGKPMGRMAYAMRPEPDLQDSGWIRNLHPGHLGEKRGLRKDSSIAVGHKGFLDADSDSSALAIHHSHQVESNDICKCIEYPYSPIYTDSLMIYIHNNTVMFTIKWNSVDVMVDLSVFSYADAYQVISHTMVQSEYALCVLDNHILPTQTYECYKCVWLYSLVSRVRRITVIPAYLDYILMILKELIMGNEMYNTNEIPYKDLYRINFFMIAHFEIYIKINPHVAPTILLSLYFMKLRTAVKYCSGNGKPMRRTTHVMRPGPDSDDFRRRNNLLYIHVFEFSGLLKDSLSVAGHRGLPVANPIIGTICENNNAYAIQKSYKRVVYAKIAKCIDTNELFQSLLNDWSIGLALCVNVQNDTRHCTLCTMRDVSYMQVYSKDHVNKIQYDKAVFSIRYN